MFSVLLCRPSIRFCSSLFVALSMFCINSTSQVSMLMYLKESVIGSLLPLFALVDATCLFPDRRELIGVKVDRFLCE